MSPIAIVGIVLACGVVAYVISHAIVIVLDLLGLCWSEKGEAKSHADDVPSFNVQARRRFDR